MIKTNIYFLFIVSCALVNCNLFETRKPEIPLNRQSSWLIPLDADQVLTNLQASIYEQHLDNFMRCLADTAYISQAFHFEADEEIRSAYTYLFENWSRASEAAVIQQMFSLAASSGDVYLELEEEARENASPELLLWTGNYELILVHQMENLPSIFKGQIIFHLAPDERGHWVIFYWLDNAAPGSPGWSGLKARLGG